MIAPASASSSGSTDDVTRFYGKFRGVVLNNYDPEGLARIQVQVADVSRIPLINWALPCAPVGGLKNGIVSVPNIGSGVWVEFEQGDPDYPIWTGCYWGSSAEFPDRRPQQIPGIQTITIQTLLRNSIVISDLPGPTGGIQIKTATEAKIAVTDLGIEIDNGKGASIKMIGPTIMIDATMVSINGSNLTILK
jgi:uncharacterized protein involved in type VI secretion and phage assembly